MRPLRLLLLSSLVIALSGCALLRQGAPTVITPEIAETYTVECGALDEQTCSEIATAAVLRFHRDEPGQMVESVAFWEQDGGGLTAHVCGARPGGHSGTCRSIDVLDLESGA